MCFSKNILKMKKPTFSFFDNLFKKTRNSEEIVFYKKYALNYSFQA